MNTQQEIKQVEHKIRETEYKIVSYKASIEDKKISISETYKSIQDFKVSSEKATDGIHLMESLKSEISKLIGQISRSKNRIKDYEIDLERLNKRLNK